MNFRTFIRPFSFFNPFAPDNRSHVVGAILVASLIVALKSVGALERFKVITLNAIGAAVALDDSKRSSDRFVDPACLALGPTPPPAECPDAKTFLLTLDQRAWEEAFEQRSPLDRSKLADLLQHFLATKQNTPAVLAIDLDLSPGLPQPNKVDSPALNGDEKLTKALLQLADAGTEIVLVVPNPVGVGPLHQEKLRWMDELLHYDKVHFGLGSIYTLDGMSTKYIDAPSAFARTIHRAAAGRFIAENESANGRDDRRIMLSACDGGTIADAGQGVTDRCDREVVSAWLTRSWRSGISEGRIFKASLKHYNYRFQALPANQKVRLLDRHETWATALESLPNLNGQIVILGADYGVRDYHNMALGSQPGVMLHYAAFYSMVFSVTEQNTWLPFFAEIVVGFLMAVFLRGIFAVDVVMKHVVFRLVPVIAVVLVFVLLGYVSYQLLTHWNFWINPLPLFIGILVHSLVDYVKDGLEEAHDSSAPAHRSSICEADWYKRSDRQAGYILGIGLVGYALVYLIHAS